MLIVIVFMPYGLEGVIEKWRKRGKGGPEDVAYDAEKR
jgi:hypothetical protein